MLPSPQTISLFPSPTRLSPCSQLTSTDDGGLYKVRGIDGRGLHETSCTTLHVLSPHLGTLKVKRWLLLVTNEKIVRFLYEYEAHSLSRIESEADMTATVFVSIFCHWLQWLTIFNQHYRIHYPQPWGRIFCKVSNIMMTFSISFQLVKIWFHYLILQGAITTSLVWEKMLLSVYGNEQYFCFHVGQVNYNLLWCEINYTWTLFPVLSFSNNVFCLRERSCGNTSHIVM